MDLGQLGTVVALAAPPLAITAYCGLRYDTARSQAFARFTRWLEDKGLTLERPQRDNWHFTGSWLGYPVSAAVVKRYISSDYHTCTELRLTAPAAQGRAVVYAHRFDLPRRIKDELASLPAAKVDAELEKRFRVHAAPDVDLAARLVPDLRSVLVSFDGLVSLDAEGEHVTVALDGVEPRPQHVEAGLDLAAAYIEPRPVGLPPKVQARLNPWGLGIAAVILPFWPAFLLSREHAVARHIQSSDATVQFLAVFDAVYLVLIVTVAIVVWVTRPSPRAP